MTSYSLQTVETAPGSAKPALAGLQQAFGLVPNGAGLMANCPALLNSFFAAFGQFRGAGTFAPGERQVLLLTNAVTNRAAWAVAFHSALALDVPLRDRNTMLLAAGFAPVYQESALDAPALAAVRGALDPILEQHEPYPALVMDRSWDIRLTNAGAARFFDFLRTDRVLRTDRTQTSAGSKAPPAPPNVLRRMFHPDGVRRHVTNWPDVAEALVRRVRREAIGGVTDEKAQRILDEVLAYPGVPASLRSLDAGASLLPIVPVRYARGDRTFNYFSTVTTLGTPQDVTLQELRIECFFPADDETRAHARELEKTNELSGVRP